MRINKTEKYQNFSRKDIYLNMYIYVGYIYTIFTSQYRRNKILEIK